MCCKNTCSCTTSNYQQTVSIPNYTKVFSEAERCAFNPTMNRYRCSNRCCGCGCCCPLMSSSACCSNCAKSYCFAK